MGGAFSQEGLGQTHSLLADIITHSYHHLLIESYIKINTGLCICMQNVFLETNVKARQAGKRNLCKQMLLVSFPLA